MSANASINLRITAENETEKAFRQVEMQTKQMVNGVRDFGEQTKKTTELAGALASTLGGTQLGSYAGQVAMVVDRVKEFRFTLEKGGAGAVAFGVATGAAVAAVAVQVGQEIGKMIWEVERWEKELQRANKVWDELQGSIQSSQSGRLEKEVSDIKAIADEADRRAAAEAKVVEIRTNMAAKETQLNSLRKQRNDLADKWFQTAETKASIDILDKQIENRRAEYQDLLKARESLRGEGLNKEREAAFEKERQQRVAASQEYIKGLLQEKQIAEAIGDERMRLELAKSGVFGEEDVQQAMQLKKELQALADAEKKKQEAEKERDEAAKRRIAEAKRINELERDTLLGLKEQAIAMTSGKSAAEQFRLEMEGIDEKTAGTLSGMKERLAQLQGQAGKSGLAGDLTASGGGRLITGKGAEFRKSAADIESERQTKIQTESKKLLASIDAAIQNLQPVQINVLGE